MNKARGTACAPWLLRWAFSGSAAGWRIPGLATVLVTSFVFVFLSASASSGPAALWVADQKALKRLDPASNSFVQQISITHEVDAVGVDPANGTVWALIDKHLVKWNTAGALQADLDVKKLAANFPNPKLLALNPHDGSLWVAGEKGWLHLASTGQFLAQGKTTDDIEALALDAGEGLWVLTEKQLLHLAPPGTLEQVVSVKPYLSDPEHLALDSLGGYLWVAGKNTLLRFELADLSKTPLAKALPNSEKIEALLAHPLEGTLWVATKNALLVYDPSATLERQTPLSGYNPGEIVQLAFEPRSASLWLAGKKALARFTPEGDFVARLPAEQQLDALGVEPFELRPTVTILNPPDSSLTNNPRPTLKLELGAECNGLPCELVDSYYAGFELAAKLNNQPVGSLFTRQDRVLSYQPATRLPDGVNILTARVTDAFDHDSQEATGHFTVDTVAPKFTSLTPADGTTVATAQATIQGQLDDPTGSVTLQNASGAVLNLGGASFSFTITLQSGLNSFTLTAQDPAGNVTTIPYRLTLQTGPILVPTPINPTVATILADVTAFLYSGSNPVQTGVAPGTIEPRRAAVIRGKVLARGGIVLPGVKVAVLNHPEFGATESRQNGEFDMAVNGGGVLTLTYTKAGYLPAQRQVNAPWQDYAQAPDVILVPLDSQATVINLAAPVPMQVARGGVVTDEDGTRQATVFFPQGTTATLVKPDGSTQALSTITVRATEYTVGAEGPNSMPAPLPPTSAYTYAVELSIDEAMAAGARTVQFSQPVITYVDNFLGFPIGGIVPTGIYDHDRGVWVPHDNGRIIRILSITGGLATLDADNDGNADSAAQLAALGITDAERAQLASVYPAGKSLWRVPINHFSTVDCNWARRLPDGAEPPNGLAPPPDRCPGGGDEKTGSIIGCQSQTVGEKVSATGTPFQLNYRSDRVPGRVNPIKIKLSGAAVPPPLKRIDLEISVAGRVTTQSFPPLPNQSYEFVWDERDAYGRTIYGEQLASIRLGYVYDVVYAQPVQRTRSFGLISEGITLSTNRTRDQLTLWQSMQTRTGTWDARNQGFGGWTLDVHHTYNPASRTLYLGTGRTRNAENDLLVVTRVVGNGLQGFSGDGGPAVNAKLYDPMGLAVDAAGNLFIADSVNHRVRKVTTDGIITTVAGNGSALFGGDGGPATAAGMVPHDVAVDARGSLYILDGGSNRIRKVTPDGIINTVAGNGSAAIGSGGDGGPATAAQLGSPQSIALDSAGNLYIGMVSGEYDYKVRKVGSDGIITTVAGSGLLGFTDAAVPATKAPIDPIGISVDSSGSLYIANTWGHRIQRVGPDGIIRTIAGTGYGGSNGNGFRGDGGPATSASLSFPYGVTVDRSGNIWIADTADDRIRHITPYGIITTAAGIGVNGYGGDNGPAAAAVMNDPRWLATDPAGNLYFAELHAEVVRKISLGLPSYTGADVAIPAADGSEVYYFDAAGRHLRTVHATTGAVRYEFSYDASGYLTAITDGDGNVTTIERSSSIPTAIISPYGQRTSLQLDGNGYLASIVNPANEATIIGYTPGGLLTSFTNPRGFTSTMTYDELGRLTRDQNAAGGFWALARTQSDSRNLEIAVSSALGRTTTYRVENLATGDEHRGNTEPDGRVSDTLIKTDGTTVSTAADGTVTTTVQGPDPRFGMQAPIIKSTTIKLPSGLTSSATVSRTVSLSDPNNLLSLTNQTDTITTNGKVSTSVYTAASRQTVFTTPAGRKFTTVTDAQGRPIQSQIGGLEPLRYNYDARGRVTTITQGSGAETRSSTISYNPQGYTGALTDSIGEATGFGYDAAGRTTQQTLPDGRVILWSYDANGNIVGLTPPSRPQHGFTYTPVDLESQYTPPAVAGVTNPGTQYTYDADKNLTQISRPDGQLVTLFYDTAGRLAFTTMPHGTLSQTYNAVGQLASLGAPGGVTTNFTYDGSLPLSETVTGPVAGTLTRSYNSDFRITGITVNGAPIALGYDNDGLLTQAGSLTLARHAQHGLITATALGSASTAHTYNGFGELQNFTASNAGTGLYSFSLTRDTRGHITQKSETVQGQTDGYSYGYDATGRLISVVKNGVQIAAYGYDGNGNRTRLVTPLANIAASYDDQDRLLTYGGNAYTYTGNGEVKTKTQGGLTTSYTYDVLGNLTKVILPDTTVIEYLIDGQNRRVGKTINGSLVQGFLYQDQLRPVAEIDGSGNVVSRFVYGEKPNVPEYFTKGGNSYRIVTDHLGSTRLVVNTVTDAVVQRMDYDEFGNVLQDTNPGFQPFSYAGGLYDPQTKLVRFGARDYDAETGRWTGKDPIRFKGGDTNLYLYTYANPLTWTDPAGLMGFGGGASIPGIRPGNGNLWGGPSPQDMVCTKPMITINPCVKDCCVEHDECYKRYGCNWSSWGGNMAGTSFACQQCNATAVKCVFGAIGRCDKQPCIPSSLPPFVAP